MGFFMSFHERLKQKMEEKGVTPAALARAASVSPVAAGKWVHGESEPKAAKLKLIADFNTYDQLPKVLEKNVNYEIML